MRSGWAATMLALPVLFALPQCSSFGTAATPQADAGPEAGVEHGQDAAADASAACPPETDYTQPANCGTCGHDCGGGTCTDGECGAYVLAKTASPPWYVALDADHVYWGSFIFPEATGNPGDGSIARVSKKGGPVEPVTKHSDAFHIAVDGDDLLFTAIHGGGQGVFRVPKKGGEPAPLTTSMAGVELAAGNGGWYVTMQSASEAVIGFLPTTGELDVRVTFPPGANTEGIAFDGKHVYWANHGAPTTPGSIGRMEPTAQVPGEPWEADQRFARRLVVDGTDVYWTRFDATGGIFRRGKTSNVVEHLLAANVNVGSIVVDGSHIWATVAAEGRVVRLPKKGGDAVNIVKDLKLPVGIAEDQTAIYFSERDASQIWRKVK